jgi:uncharacterized delta-60 repeat protein
VRSWSIRTAVLASVIAFALPVVASAGAGSGLRDRSFGDRGLATSRFDAKALSSDLLRTSDGGILAIGFVNNRFALAKFTRNGALDRTFGGGDGMVVRSGPDAIADHDAIAAAEDAWGRIVLVADRSGAGRVVVGRLLADGRRDDTFGWRGFIDIVTDSFVQDVAVDPDGAVEILGQNNTGYTIWKVAADGHTDTDFGDLGSVFVPRPAPLERWVSGSRMEIDQAGRLVVLAAGIYRNPDSHHLIPRPFVFRVTGEGVLDPAFGDGGSTIAKRPYGGFEPTGMVLLADGSIVASGTPRAFGIALIRFTPSGAVDKTFGDRGAASYPRNGYFLPTDLESGPGGTLVASVTSEQGATVVRLFAADGALDTSFGHGGYAVRQDTSFGQVALIVQHGGAVVSLGQRYVEATRHTQFAVVRSTA